MSHHDRDRDRDREVIYEQRDEYRRSSGRDRDRSRDRDRRDYDDGYSRRGERDRDPDFLRDDYGRTDAGPLIRVTNGDRPRRRDEEDVHITEEREVDIRRARSEGPRRDRERDRETDIRIERDSYERDSLAPRSRTRDHSRVDRDTRIEREVIESDTITDDRSPRSALTEEILLARDEYGSVYDRGGDIVINRYLKPGDRERDLTIHSGRDRNSGTVIEKETVTTERSVSPMPPPRRRGDSFVERDTHERVERRRSPSPAASRSRPRRDADVYIEKDKYKRVERRRSPSPSPLPPIIIERDRDGGRGTVIERDKYERIERRRSPSLPPARERDRDVYIEKDNYERVERRHSPSPPPRSLIRDRDRDTILERDTYERSERRRSPSPLPPPRARDRELDVRIERDTYERIERDGGPARPRSTIGRDRERDAYERDTYERVESDHSGSRLRPRERDRGGDVVRERDTFERDISRGPRGEKEVHERETIEREVRDHSPDRHPQPEAIYRPPIHQDIIYHHKHIDYASERAPRPRIPSPSPPDLPPAPEPAREVDTYSKHERIYEDDRERDRDVRIRRETDIRESHTGRSRSMSGTRSGRGQELAIRGPPRRPPRGTAQDELWTEVTKDLVVKEALEERGLEFQETTDYFYVMRKLSGFELEDIYDYSRYIRRARRDRIRDIQREREYRDRDGPSRHRNSHGYHEHEDDIIREIERDYVYDGPARRPPPRRVGY